MTNRWYAVQETEEDAWDYGSKDYSEAVAMACAIADKNGIAYIAYIDEDANFCDGCEIVEKDGDEYVWGFKL